MKLKKCFWKMNADNEKKKKYESPLVKNNISVCLIIK